MNAHPKLGKEVGDSLIADGKGGTMAIQQWREFLRTRQPVTDEQFAAWKSSIAGDGQPPR